MDTSFLKYVASYATYKEIFRMEYDKDQLKKLIWELPLGGVLHILSQVCSFFNLEDDKTKEAFISYVESLEPDNTFPFRERLQPHLLYSLQSLLTVWKWLLAYGDEKKLDQKIYDPQQGLNIVIYLSLIVSDYVPKGGSEVPSKLAYEWFRNVVFNSMPDPAISLARSAWIYGDLAKDRNLASEREFVDINGDFETNYHFGIKCYLSVILGLFGLFINPAGPEGWQKRVDIIFSETSINDIALQIIEPLMLDFGTVHAWALQTLENPWDFSLFKQKPLFLMKEKQFLPFSSKILDEHLFRGLFYKIRDCYPPENKRFLDYFGRPFEAYAGLLMTEALKTSPIDYEYIPEFSYGRDNKRSPDVMLKLGNKLLAIEVKSYRLKLDSIIGDSTESIDSDLEKLVINPLKQAHDRLEEILQLGRSEFQGITEIYIMVVTFDDFPTVPIFETQVSAILKEYFRIPIHSFYHFDIEEYELMCYLISRKNGRPIFRILNNKYNNHPNICFRNFLSISSLPVKRMRIIDDKKSEFMAEAKSILFPHE